MTRFARIRRRLARERGFTLIEVLVSGLIGVVIIGVAFGLLDAVVRTFGNSGTRIDVSQRGRLAIDQLTQKLRSQVCGGTPPASYTPAVVSATKDKVVFWSDIGDGQAKRLRGLEYAGGTIRELQFPGTGTDPNATPTTRDLVADVRATNAVDPAPASTGLFRYWAYDANAANQALNLSTPYRELAAPVAAADLRSIVRITVSFTSFPRGSDWTDKTAANFTGDFVSRTATSPYEFTEVPSDPAVLEPRCK